MTYRPQTPEPTDYSTYPDETALLGRAAHLAFHINRAESSPAVMAYYHAEINALLDELTTRLLAA
jgi:hypothetical protein